VQQCLDLPAVTMILR